MEKEKENYQFLLEEYRSIWNNRSLSTRDQTSEETLIEAIKRELLDENSHPRIRKDKYEKYYSAVKRVMASQISLDSKGKLIEMHIEVMEEIS
ncbi:hypothetical protein J1P26_01125 [Neobacillus sp. MM2021_6]|uniref:hypothetical protein n=1 Tax=Bacillaceae TaxID=186817 RepID=UPI00140DF215|nr:MULTISPECIES: hypothetical protein [Bacillaceae]MBO0958320.1 hypothetical protein [Neobacillus sp. MM2021_6]NHC17920.1 hypothetical protein [Bacillus sp. MM2020_4]